MFIKYMYIISTFVLISYTKCMFSTMYCIRRNAKIVETVIHLYATYAIVLYFVYILRIKPIQLFIHFILLLCQTITITKGKKNIFTHTLTF